MYFLRLRLNGYTNIDINIYLLIYYTKVTYTYYVLFYMKDCSHCNALESDMFDNISKIMKKDIFYYDAETFTDDSEFEWANTNPGDKYTSTKREFKVYGTPTLVKVSPGTEKIKVFMGNEAIEEELGLS